MVKKDINETAKKKLKEFYLIYFIKRDLKKAEKLSEEIYREFSAAVGTLLEKKVSEVVIEVGKYWINKKLSNKSKKILEELKKAEEKDKETK
ncbi:MAG: hypothetical protein QW273_02050 [Candidatus Pacearchaeota archaeon]